VLAKFGSPATHAALAALGPVPGRAPPAASGHDIEVPTPPRAIPLLPFVLHPIILLRHERAVALQAFKFFLPKGKSVW
jgi:hypothetical protein